jgi:hypothetical protein
MFKKYIAIILLCISNFFMVGHSVIPHDHSLAHEHDVNDHHGMHAAIHDHHHHHERDQKSTKNQTDDDHSSIFEFYTHSDFIRNESDPKTTIGIERHADVVVELASIYLYNRIENATLKSRPYYYRDPDYKPPTDYQCGLRAPPIFFS